MNPAIRRGAVIGALAGIFFVIGSLSSQPPKAKPAPPRPKFSARQVAEAEARLLQANCTLHHEELPPLVPNGPPGKGGVDIIAFPTDITDAQLAQLIPFAARLPNLKTIDLGHAQKITARGFKKIAALADLKAIFLDGCQVDANCLRELVVLKDLQWIDLSRSSLRDDDLKVLADYPALQNLTLIEVPALTAAGLVHLQKMGRLRVLHVSVEADPLAMMTEVARCDGLVELRAYPVGNSEAREIGKLFRLQVLDLNNGHDQWRAWRGEAIRGRDLAGLGRAFKDPEAQNKLLEIMQRRSAYTGITSAGFPHLLKCTDLQVLKLAGHPIDVNGSGLDQLEFLQELDLSGTDFTDNGVTWLGRLKSLKKLWLSGTEITNEGVKGLAVAGGLELVALDYLPITDETVEHLARNRKLKELSLNNTRVACADKKAWAGFGRLEYLHLQTTNVTDATLLNLAPLKTLRYVDATMNCPNVTPNGAMGLQRELLPQSRVLAHPCELSYWPGGGGVSRGTREPDLNYRKPKSGRPTASLTPNPPKTKPKAPPRPVRIAPLPGSGKP